MGIFDRFRSRKPRTAHRSRLSVEPLESRLLLSASASLTGGVLSIAGDGGNDRILVREDSATAQLLVQDRGHTVGQFASSAVQQIQINTGSGNCFVMVAPNVTQPTTMNGGAGKNVLLAGSGPTTMTGGTGGNKLVGGSGTDQLVGGAGPNTIISRSDSTTVTGGTGPNQVFAHLTNVVTGTHPGDTVVGPLAPDPVSAPESTVTLTPAEVNTLLNRAAAATPEEDGIVVVVDREGNILGVRVEGNVSPAITGNPEKLVYAIDGALAEARTAAFFANDQAPLTSRTVQFISQSTHTQREIQSDPNIPDPNSPLNGPGFVAPIGVKAHFPPGIAFTPMVDLFDIEATNRDSLVNPGPDGIRGTADDVNLTERFNANPAFVPTGQSLPAPESYGLISGLFPNAQARGIGTLPGGIPIFKTDPGRGNLPSLVGGIGVFFPGTTGFATEENSSLNDALYNPNLPDRSLEAEAVAFAAVGGSSQATSTNHPNPGAFRVSIPLGGVPALPELDLPGGRIDLVGIALDLFGPGGPNNGPDRLLSELVQANIGQGNPLSGVNEPIVKGGAPTAPTLGPPPAAAAKAGTLVPEGWLVLPHAGGGLTADDVTRIVDQGIAQAERTRAAIRLPLNSTAQMTFAVTDRQGNLLGLYRMPDSTYFSIDVAVAKARNVAYYADPTQLQSIDQVPGIAPGVAFSNRTFRFLADPRFPEGIDGSPPGLFSILNVGAVDPTTGANVGAPLPASAYYANVQGNNDFHPASNFHQPWSPNQNGVVLFPGSTPLYKNGQLVGGLGVSGDGVDQDDVVTFAASGGYSAFENGVPQADQFEFRGVRLPFQKFNRNPNVSS
jgi:uncharacterized protein GlcG (DUF336 family)